MLFRSYTLSLLDGERLSYHIGDYRVTPYSVMKGLLALIILFWAAGVIADVGEKYISTLHKIRASNRALVTKAFQIFVYFIAFLVALDIFNIDLTALTVFSGAIGIGIGFGLQKVTSNFISGIILLFEKSVEKDDLVELSDGTYGFIRRTGARYTLVETFEGKEIMIPNEDFITNRVTNWTFSNKKGRVEIPVGVSYGSDLELAHKLMLEAVEEHPRCISDPEPVCYLCAFADSSVNFLLHFWVADVTEGRMLPQSEVMFSIWRKFKQHGIEIPFPQRDIHIRSAVSTLTPNA